MCSSPLASARSVPGTGCRCSAAPRGGRGPPRIDHDVHARRWPGRRRSTAWPAASCRPGWRRPAGSRPPRRCRTAGTAARGRSRRPGCRPSPPTTCRTGRCSRWPTCAARPGRTCRAGRPSRWSGRRRRNSRRRPARSCCCAAVDAVGDQVERLVPAAGPQRTRPVARDRAHQRGEQPVRVVEQARRRSSPWSTARRGWSGSPAAAAGSPGRSTGDHA